MLSKMSLSGRLVFFQKLSRSGEELASPVFSSLRGTSVFHNVHTSSSPSSSSSSSTAAIPIANEKDNPENARPFSDIPGPKGFLTSLLGMVRAIRNSDKTLVLLGEGFDTFGKIFKAKFGYAAFVNLCEINAVEKVHRMEGKYPRRLSVRPWSDWREDNKLSKGILIELVDSLI